MFNENDYPSQDFLLNKMKTGRPKLPLTAKKAQILGVRMLSHEKALIEAAARSDGLKPSEWARNVLLGSAKPVLKDAA